MTCFIFVGPPCSGKSTMAREASRRLKLPYISSGDIARKMADNDEEIGKSLADGRMAPEGRMRNEIKNEILKYQHGVFILDGFPRNNSQMTWLKNNFPLLEVNIVLVTAHINSLMIRMAKRAREDDNTMALDNRLRYYIANTQPLIDDTAIKIENDDGDMMSAISKTVQEIRSEIGC